MPSASVSPTGGASNVPPGWADDAVEVLFGLAPEPALLILAVGTAQHYG